ncbi:MAG: amidohydrolase [Chloroflexi bacterium HGW-Chloroflexi-10]|nr:MAG: amidohydrolase [Chloroflexi bacterium HGW-Chloroflexi-10]
MMDCKKIIIKNANIFLPSGWLCGSIGIEDGLIKSISSGNPESFVAEPSDELIDAKGMAVLPGLVNGHTHFSQTFMRGLAGGRPLLQWLRELIWPLQAEISVEEMQLAALLGLAENLRCGVTNVIDHHKITRTMDHTLAVQQAAESVGIRCTIARAWVNKGKNPENDQTILDELAHWFEKTNSSEKVNFASGPLTPWRCSAELLQKTHQLAVKNGSFTHIHVSETAEEVQMSMDEYQVRPVTWLDQIGVLDKNTQIVHAVWVDETEIELLASRDALIVHCPVSNAVLGSGIAPLRKLLNAGMKIRLGTDGPASNDTQDCFENMKMAICLARASQNDANNISCRDALSMATSGNELVPGAKADLILVDLNNLHSSPIQDFDSALALCAKGDDVDTVLVAGEILMRDKKIVSIDEEVLIKECNQAVRSLRKRAGVDS